MFDYIKKIFKLNYKKNIELSMDEWEKRQFEDELNFWKHPDEIEGTGEFDTYEEKHFNINKNMFHNIHLNFTNKVVCDIGCGPNGGFLSHINDAKIKLAIDPLVDEYLRLKRYKHVHNQHPDIFWIKAITEKIPIASKSIDASYCVNSLDHMIEPYKALQEMIRILKKGGYLAFSVDIGGTPGHPHKILEKDLDKVLLNGNFEIIEKKCSSEIESSWPKELKIPLYVFQGIKR